MVFLAPWWALAPQGGHLSSSKSKDSIRIDLRPQMWQSTSIVVCFGLVSAVACVLLVVAIYDMDKEGKEEENDDGGMDEEEEENDDDHMEGE